MNDDAGQERDGRGELVAQLQRRGAQQNLFPPHERRVEAAAIDVLETEVRDRLLLDSKIDGEGALTYRSVGQQGRDRWRRLVRSAVGIVAYASICIDRNIDRGEQSVVQQRPDRTIA